MNFLIFIWFFSSLDESDPDDLYQDWSQEYEQWRDVHMTEWNEAFEEYKEGNGCDQPWSRFRILFNFKIGYKHFNL